MKTNLDVPSSQEMTEGAGDEAIFEQFGLHRSDEFPHIHGSTRGKDIGLTPDGMHETIVGLRKGTHYQPETHSYAHILTIQYGHGRISVDGQEKTYGPGDTFDVAGNVPHGFTSVEETTIVSQKSL
jgi:quercetin dioxygenase-like cupin family protein